MLDTQSFEYPTSGNLLLDGSDITALPPDKRPTNMVFQNYAIFPHINVEKNIQFGLRKLGQVFLNQTEYFFLH